jgi:hypothetical protein
METQIKHHIFGVCKVCKLQDATKSSMVCDDCWEKKQKVVRRLFDEGHEPGTQIFIDILKKEGVYY